MELECDVFEDQTVSARLMLGDESSYRSAFIISGVNLILNDETSAPGLVFSVEI